MPVSLQIGYENTLMMHGIRMQADLAAGKLDNLIAKVESDIEANQLRELDEVLNNT